MHAVERGHKWCKTNIMSIVLTLTLIATTKTSNCPTTLPSGNKTPQSQSAESRSESQVGSVSSSLNLSLEGLSPNSNASSLLNQTTSPKEKKSKKKKVLRIDEMRLELKLLKVLNGDGAINQFE